MKEILYTVPYHSTKVVPITLHLSGALNIRKRDPAATYRLLEKTDMYYGFANRVDAMKYAKTSALAHITALVGQIKAGIKKLKIYREEHYEDLNINLLDSEIGKLEKEMGIK